MKRVFQFLRATLTGGILFLVPIIIVVIILERALKLADKLVEPLARHISTESVAGLRPARWLAIGLLLLFCFLAGVFARTNLARKLVQWLETAVLSNLPGYEFFRETREHLFGSEKSETQRVVFAWIGDTWRLGLLEDRLDNGLLAVFIPAAPNPHTGALHFVPADRVAPTDVPPHAALKNLKRLGAGSNELFGRLSLTSEKSTPIKNHPPI